MSMKRILFFNAPTQVRQWYRDSEWAAFQEKGTLIYRGRHGDSQTLNTENVRFETLETRINEIEIANSLIQRYPIFGRWIFRLPDLNIYKEILVLRVWQIMQSFRLLGITDILFFTRSPHHLFTIVWDIAAEKAGIRRCFVGKNPLTGLLHPRFASDSLGEMNAGRAFSRLASDSLEGYVRDYVSRSLIGLPPMYNSVYGKRHTSYSLSMLTIIASHTRRIIKSLTTARGNSLAKEYALNNSYGLIEDLWVMRTQSNAVAYYREQCISKERALASEEPACLPVVYAHLQPEATTFPDGADYHDHIRVVMALRRLGYDGKIIYQEHRASFKFTGPMVGPTRAGAFRSIAYYKALEELGCVFVAPGAINSLEPEICNKVLPISITGSIALERALNGLPAIIAGKPWFKGVPNVYEIDNFPSSRNFADFFRVDSEPAAEEAKAYIKTVLEGMQFEFFGKDKFRNSMSDCEDEDARQEFESFLSVNSFGCGKNRSAGE